MNLVNYSIPNDSSWLFPEYDFDTMDIKRHQGVIIERILEKGNWEQLRWMFTIYGKPTVTRWVQQHGFRLLSKRSFSLWRLVLDVTDYHAPEWAVMAKEMDKW